MSVREEVRERMQAAYECDAERWREARFCRVVGVDQINALLAEGWQPYSPAHLTTSVDSSSTAAPTHPESTYSDGFTTTKTTAEYRGAWSMLMVRFEGLYNEANPDKETNTPGLPNAQKWPMKSELPYSPQAGAGTKPPTDPDADVFTYDRTERSG